MEKFGIDISVYQKGFDFDRALSEGVEFGIIRGAYHLSKDSTFEEHYKALRQKNVPVGVYHYSTATTPDMARQEADFLMENVLKGKRFQLPIYMDVEDKTQMAIGKKALTDTVLAFCGRLREGGYLPGVYASLGFLNRYLEDERLGNLERWIAQWYTYCQYTGDLGVWQFGGEQNYLRSNRVAGVVCDQNYCYKDYESLIKGEGLNGYGQEEAPQKSLLTVDGKWGTATTRRLQEIFAIPADGEVSNQYAAYREANPGLLSGWDWQKNPKRSSSLIQAMQKWAGMPVSAWDGYIGPSTVRAFQKKLGTVQDGVVSNPSSMVAALQTWANSQ